MQKYLKSFNIDRVIPDNLNMAIFRPLFGVDYELVDGQPTNVKFKEKTIEAYLKEIAKFEMECEKSLIETLSRLSIQATVKTDRYSLPYQKECEDFLYGESYMNGPYEFHRVAKKFVKHLLNEDVAKIRFYILVDVHTDGKRLFNMGKISYKLRYYVHY